MVDWDYIRKQRAYWENNLDPENLGHRGEVVMPPSEVSRRLRFYNLSPHLKRVRSLMGDVEGKRILELGGGMSVQPLVLARLGADVWVADVSVRRLEALERLAKNWRVDVGVHCVTAAAEALPFDDGAFDIVTTNAVLIHTRLDGAAKEIHRVLKPGGHAIISEPMAGNPFVNLYRKTFAPAEWRDLTKYFTHDRFKILADHFPDSQLDHYYISGFLPYLWQFKFPVPWLFRAGLAITQPVDSILFSVSGGALHRAAWFGVFSGEKK